MRNSLIATVIGAALLAAPPAWAVSITISSQSWYDAANNASPTPGTFDKTDFNGLTQKITLAGFDKSLGTLTAATLTFLVQTNASGLLTNNGASTVLIKQYIASLQARLLSPSNALSGPGITTPATGQTAYLLDDEPVLLKVIRSTLASRTSIGFDVRGVSDTHTLDLLTSTALPFFESTGASNVILPLFTSTSTLSTLSGGNLSLT